MKEINGNIVSDDAKVLLFSIDNFVETICNKDTCFICGVERTDAVFNDEHVIPRWILKRFDLFGKLITLPNDKTFRYGKYKIPCCKNCNSLLGDNIEKKISEGFDGDYGEVLKFFNENKESIFIWICLLYIKTHLKDRMFKSDFKSDKKIGDDYNWEELHHIHCVARSIYTKVNIEESVYGSMFIYPCAEFDEGEKYDYIDLYGTGTVLIRLGAFCVICVLNDSKITSQLIKSRTERITGKLNFLQMRELYSRVTYDNLRIVDRPKYITYVKLEDNFICIDSLIEQAVAISPHNEELLGSIMYKLVKDYIFKPDTPELKVRTQEQIKAVKNGQWTYLFDSEGKFLNDSVIIIEDEGPYVEDLKNNTGPFSW